MKKTVLAAFVLTTLGAPVLAAVSVKDPWVRVTTSYQKSTVAFMQLTSSEDARLVKAESPVANQVEFHEMVMKNYMMKMQAIPAIDLPAGKVVELKPEGCMVMLTGLKQQVKEGDSIPLSIVIEGKNRKRETIKLDAKAMTMDAAASGKDAAGMQDHEHMDGPAHEHMHDHEHMD